MAKITKAIAIHDLAEFLKVQEQIINGAVGIADFTDWEVRELLLDQLQDEIDELWEKWVLPGSPNDSE